MKDRNVTRLVDPLTVIRLQVTDDADAIRWACVLEATAPKAGNVHPGKSFADLSYADFVVAADATAESLTRRDLGVAQRMFEAVSSSKRQTQSNVNLGIVLLLGPLVAAEATETSDIAEVLASFTPKDGKVIFDAIRIAGAGGLGQSDSMDVVTTTEATIDVLAAMQHAQSYDRIAQQYAGCFADLLENVVPIVRQSIQRCAAPLAGIADAHLVLLSQTPDTLIARKCGDETALDVQRRAGSVDRSDPTSIAAFDRYLRSRGNSLNPGTTADLIAAALYVLLRPPRNGTSP